MDWTAIQTKIPEVIQTILADDSFDVGWKDRESRWRNPSHVVLSVLDSPARGRDEQRYTPEGDAVRERIYGVRRLVVQIEVERQAQSLADSAQAIADNLRAGFFRSDVEGILDAAGLGVAIVQPARTANYRDDTGRWRSVVLFDVFFNAHVSHVGPLVPTIKQIEFTGTAEGGPAIGPETVSGS